MEVKVGSHTHGENLRRDTRECLELLGQPEASEDFGVIENTCRAIEELPWSIAERIADFLGEGSDVAARELYLSADKRVMADYLINLANILLEASSYMRLDDTEDCRVVPFSAWLDGHFFGCTTLFIRTVEWQEEHLELNEGSYSPGAVMQGITKSLAACLITYLFSTNHTPFPTTTLLEPLIRRVKLNLLLIPVVEEYCRENMLRPELYVAPLPNQRGILLKWFDFKPSPFQKVVYPHPHILGQNSYSASSWLYKVLGTIKPYGS